MPHDQSTAGARRHPEAIGSVRPLGWVYQAAPMIVYWELTNACGLACSHCRATAMPNPAPGELSTPEALDVLDEIVRFGSPTPHVVMTGGDPLRRPDLRELVRAAVQRGIGVSLAPAVTPDLTFERLKELRDDGISAISLSLDGSGPQTHDVLRGVPGTFEATMTALKWAAELDLPVQVNTLVTTSTAPDLPAILDVLADQKIMRWSLFFLIPMGRGSVLTGVSAAEAERIMKWLWQRAGEVPFQVRTTEATMYRRVAAKALNRRGLSDEAIAAHPVSRGFGIRDGNGIMFIAHDGTVTPSGFLPIEVGNVRDDGLVELYRHSPLMRALRDPSGFSGRCGRCEYRMWCGGSRARAYAISGDALAEDPLCLYQPHGGALAGTV